MTWVTGSAEVQKLSVSQKPKSEEEIVSFSFLDTKRFCFSNFNERNIGEQETLKKFTQTSEIFNCPNCRKIYNFKRFKSLDIW